MGKKKQKRHPQNGPGNINSVLPVDLRPPTPPPVVPPSNRHIASAQRNTKGRHNASSATEPPPPPIPVFPVILKHVQNRIDAGYYEYIPLARRIRVNKFLDALLLPRLSAKLRNLWRLFYLLPDPILAQLKANEINWALPFPFRGPDDKVRFKKEQLKGADTFVNTYRGVTHLTVSEHDTSRARFGAPCIFVNCMSLAILKRFLPPHFSLGTNIRYLTFCAKSDDFLKECFTFIRSGLCELTVKIETGVTAEALEEFVDRLGAVLPRDTFRKLKLDGAAFESDAAHAGVAQLLTGLDILQSYGCNRVAMNAKTVSALFVMPNLRSLEWVGDLTDETRIPLASVQEKRFPFLSSLHLEASLIDIMAIFKCLSTTQLLDLKLVTNILSGTALDLLSNAISTTAPHLLALNLDLRHPRDALYGEAHHFQPIRHGGTQEQSAKAYLLWREETIQNQILDDDFIPAGCEMEPEMINQLTKAINGYVNEADEMLKKAEKLANDIAANVAPYQIKFDEAKNVDLDLAVCVLRCFRLTRAKALHTGRKVFSDLLPPTGSGTLDDNLSIAVDILRLAKQGDLKDSKPEETKHIHQWLNAIAPEPSQAGLEVLPWYYFEPLYKCGRLERFTLSAEDVFDVVCTDEDVLDMAESWKELTYISLSINNRDPKKKPALAGAAAQADEQDDEDDHDDPSDQNGQAAPALPSPSGAAAAQPPSEEHEEFLARVSLGAIAGMTSTCHKLRYVDIPFNATEVPKAQPRPSPSGVLETLVIGPQTRLCGYVDMDNMTAWVFQQWPAMKVLVDRHTAEGQQDAFASACDLEAKVRALRELRALREKPADDARRAKEVEQLRLDIQHAQELAEAKKRSIQEKERLEKEGEEARTKQATAESGAGTSKKRARSPDTDDEEGRLYNRRRTSEAVSNPEATDPTLSTMHTAPHQVSLTPSETNGRGSRQTAGSSRAPSEQRSVRGPMFAAHQAMRQAVQSSRPGTRNVRSDSVPFIRVDAPANVSNAVQADAVPQPADEGVRNTPDAAPVPSSPPTLPSQTPTADVLDTRPRGPVTQPAVGSSAMRNWRDDEHDTTSRNQSTGKRKWRDEDDEDVGREHKKMPGGSFWNSRK